MKMLEDPEKFAHLDKGAGYNTLTVDLGATGSLKYASHKKKVDRMNDQIE